MDALCGGHLLYDHLSKRFAYLGSRPNPSLCINCTLGENWSFFFKLTQLFWEYVIKWKFNVELLSFHMLVYFQIDSECCFVILHTFVLFSVMAIFCLFICLSYCYCKVSVTTYVGPSICLFCLFRLFQLFLSMVSPLWIGCLCFCTLFTVIYRFSLKNNDLPE